MREKTDKISKLGKIERKHQRGDELVREVLLKQGCISGEKNHIYTFFNKQWLNKQPGLGRQNQLLGLNLANKVTSKINYNLKHIYTVLLSGSLTPCPCNKTGHMVPKVFIFLARACGFMRKGTCNPRTFSSL